MTKTIESLKKNASKADILNDHIVSTYFYAKPHHKKKTKNAVNKLRAAFIASALLIAAVIAIAACLVFYNSYYLDFVKKRVESAAVISIFEGGRLNRDIIKNFEFRGFARDKSGISKGIMVFNSSEKYNWADVSMDFRFPIDLSRRDLILSIKGMVGGEKVTLVLRDAGNRSYRLKDLYAASNWKTEHMPLGEAKGDIDLSRITHIRLESGYLGESNIDSQADMTIYISGIKLMKEA